VATRRPAPTISLDGRRSALFDLHPTTHPNLANGKTIWPIRQRHRAMTADGPLKRRLTIGIFQIAVRSGPSFLFSLSWLYISIRKFAVSQRGHLVKPTGPRKTWAIMYRDGDENLRWEGKFNSRTDAQRRLTSVLAEIDKGTYTRPSSLTFGAILQGMASRATSDPRALRSPGYGSLIKSQLIPRLGSLTVSHIRFEHIDAAVSGMVEDDWPQRRFTRCHAAPETCSLADRDPSALSGAVLRSQIIHWA